MIPLWMFMFAVILLILALVGWGWTISRNVKRSVHAFNLGDAEGYRRGCLTTLKQVEQVRLRSEAYRAHPRKFPKKRRH